MRRYRVLLKNLIWTITILILSFVLIIICDNFFDTQSLIPMIFVLAVFLISLRTQGYVWGIFASLLGVLAVNFAFTFPYFRFDFSAPETLFSAIMMLCVAMMTSTLTIKLKLQEKVKADSEKEKMRANLLRAVSHDLRTPLTSIYGSCSALIENYDALSKDQHLKLLREMGEDSEWLIRMVENLLSVTRIGGGKVTLTKFPTVPDELIDAVLIKLKKRFPHQIVNVDLPDQFISIPMDALLIEQVLVNLLENAVRHATGMTELSLRVFTSGRQAIFEVADNGCGIPKEMLDRLFTGDYTKQAIPADGSKSSMGIGLTVCAAIMKAHGGSIQVENRKEGGALFRFYLEMEATEYE